MTPAKKDKKGKTKLSKTKKTLSAGNALGGFSKVVVREPEMVHGFSAEQRNAMGFAPQSHVAQYKTEAAVLVTLYDRFQAAVIANLYHPMIIYPLPSIHTTGLRRPSVYDSPGGNKVPAALNRFMRRNGNGDPIGDALIDPEPASAYVDTRYMITHGKVNKTITLGINATGTTEYWLWADPLDPQRPIRYLQIGALGVQVANIAGNSCTWTSTPFLLPRNMVFGPAPFTDDSVEVLSSAPVAPETNADATVGAWPTPGMTTAWDVNNLYYSGGTTLELEWTNQSAFTNCAIRARGLNNTIHRLFNSVDFVLTANAPMAAADLGFTDNFVSSSGVSSVYRGSMWDVSADWNSDAFFDGTVKSMFAAWNSGKPFIQIQLSTVENTATTIDFSVALSTWMGTASLVQNVAGALENETVPFDLPSYIDRGVSASHVDKSRRKRLSTLARDTIARTVPLATGDNKVGNEVAMHHDPPSLVSNLLKGVSSAVGGLVKGGLGQVLMKAAPTALAAMGKLALEGLEDLPLVLL